MNQNDQNKLINLRIANIKFSVKRKRPKAYNSRMMAQLPQQFQQLSIEHKNKSPSPSPTNHSSLIPHTNIRKGQRKASQPRSINYSSLKYPNCSYSSMFPYRKPKSTNSFHSFIPIYKQKFRLKTQGNTHHDKMFDWKVKRTAISSCLDIKSQEDRNKFVRYSSNSLKTEYISRRQQRIEERFQEVGRIYM